MVRMHPSCWQVFFRYQSWSALLLWSPTFILQITIDIHRLFGSALSPWIKALWMFNIAGVGLTAAGWWAWFQELKPWTSSHAFTYSHCSFASFCTWTCWTCWKQKEWTQSLWGAAYLMDLIIQLAVALWRTGTSWKSRTEGTVWADHESSKLVASGDKLTLNTVTKMVMLTISEVPSFRDPSSNLFIVEKRGATWPKQKPRIKQA